MLANFLKQFLRRKPDPAPGAPGPASRAPEQDTPPWLAEALQLQRLGRNREVADIARTVLAREPDNLHALQLLAAALFSEGANSEGLTCLRRAADIAPDAAEVHANLASVLASAGDPAGAIESYGRAVRLKPGLADAWNGLALLLKALGRFDEAEANCRAGLAALPRHAGLHHTLSAALFEQGRVDEAIAEARETLGLDPGQAAVHSELLRMLNFSDRVDPAAVYREHRDWARRHEAPLAPRGQSHSNDPDPGRRLRVGFVSPYFRKHAMTFFFESYVEHHDRERVEVVLYADVRRPDEYSERLRSQVAAWRNTLALDDERFARAVRDDGIDILVDLSGHSQGHRLLAFARRPAPVQVTWNGYPNTTGLTAIDYRITDAHCDPPGGTEHLSSERLVRLPGIYMTWRPPDDAPDVGPLPAAESRRVTFGSFNSAYKITPTLVALWARVLQRVRGSRLMLLTISSEAARRRVADLFAAHEIGPERLDVLPRLTHEEFLAAHGRADIALDTYPFHGITTSCFSLWMGLPLVSLAGATHVSRVGVTLLSNLGLERLVAQSGEEYVEIAARLAEDTAGLAGLRSGLRTMMLRSPLTDGAAGARALEGAFREMWTAWAQHQSHAG